MTNQVLARKWRPRNFHDVVGQPHVVKALVNGLDNDRLHHAFLFTGTRGVGKTTLARILAKSLNCEKGVSSTPCGECSICLEVDGGNFVDLIEVDAASRTKVEDTREILDNVQYAPTRGRYKVYLIDEVHMLSNSSFNALLKTLEEPPAHVKFLLATTDPQKLPVTVLSRCLRFHLKKISVDEITSQLSKLMTLEKISFELNALKMLAKAGQGSMRDALSLTDQAIAFSGQDITLASVSDMLGAIDDQHINRLLAALVSFSPLMILDFMRSISNLGIDPAGLLNALITSLHQLSLLKIDSNLISFESAQEQEDWLGFAEQLSQQDIQLFYQIALHGRRDLPLNPEPELGLEMTLLRMILMRPDNLPAVSNKLSEIPVVTTLMSKDPVILEKTLSETSEKSSENLEMPPWNIGKEASMVIEEKVLASQESEFQESELTNSVNIASDNKIDNGFNMDKPKSDESSLNVDQSKDSDSETMRALKNIVTADNWLSIIDQLILESLERSVAEYLVFESVVENTLYLTLADKYSPSLTKQVDQIIKEALIGYVGIEFNVVIKILKAVDESKHFVGNQTRIEEEKQILALKILQKDSFLTHLLDELDGQLIPTTLIFNA